MKVPLEVMLELWVASDNYLNDPTELNKRKFQTALQNVKYYERMAEATGVREVTHSEEMSIVRTSPSRRGQWAGLTIGSLVNVVTLALVIVIFVILSQGQNLFGITDATSITTEETQVGVGTMTSSTMPSFDVICGGSQRIPTSNEAQGVFRRDLGMTVYNVENTPRGVVNDNVRAIALDERGVWFGYNDLDGDSSVDGISQFDGLSWELCQSDKDPLGRNTNSINISEHGDVWIATDGSGVAVYDGQNWKTYGTKDGLSSDQTYDVVFDNNANVWVATLEGVARFDGGAWTTAYSVLRGDSIASNRVHSIAFHPDGEIWIGYISSGVSRFTIEGDWIHYTTQNNPNVLASNSVRDIILDQNGDVWIATDGGGVSRLYTSAQEWSVYTVNSSNLPSDNVYALATDRFDRVWASTSEGISYFQDGVWHLYSPVASIDLAFGPTCTECPYNNDHIWIATRTQGIAHARIAPLSDAIRVEQVEYPERVAPGERFSPKVRVRALRGYQLDTSDGLFFTGFDDSTLFGSWPVIPVKNLISPGQVYEFYAPETPFVAPADPGHYISTWRVWQDGRYVGPEISIEFTVVETETSAND